MLFVVGSIVVLVSVLGGYAAMGGKLYVLWQPFEFVIIGGAALGAFIIANPKTVLIKATGALGRVFKGQTHNKESYLELLSLMFSIFKLAKTKGMLALEQHVDRPEESPLFTRFPIFMKDHYALTFMCDYLRMLTLGTENPHEMESLIDEEISIHHAEHAQIASAYQSMADGMPALGIVAAVLGVIKTMGSISEPPEVLGRLIGGALVGTFLGVFLSYGFVGPISIALKAMDEADIKYLQCIKVGLLAHLQGYAPAVSIEFARKALISTVRPTFQEVEEAVGQLPPVGAVG